MPYSTVYIHFAHPDLVFCTSRTPLLIRSQLHAIAVKGNLFVFAAFTGSLMLRVKNVIYGTFSGFPYMQTFAICDLQCVSSVLLLMILDPFYFYGSQPLIFYSPLG